MNDQAPGILDRTLRGFFRAWRGVGKDFGNLKESVAPGLPKADADRLRAQIDACLEGRGGEVSARARAAQLGETYLVLNAAGRRRFLEILAREYDVDREVIDAAMADCQSAEDPTDRRVAEA